MNKVSIIIPSLSPDYKLLELVDSLVASGLDNIIIINDGSDSSYDNIFTKLKDERSCVVLENKKNLGKGAALKIAFNYFLDNCQDCIGLVTVDADGQHHFEDVIKLAKKIKSPNDKILYLGSRDYYDQMPARSKLGNIVTGYLFRFLTGFNTKDVQTGLRAMPTRVVENFVTTSGNRYEYELNVLLEAKEKGIDIQEEGIRTIYIDNNNSSHFHPLMDSIKVYLVFIKFLFSSLSSTFLDFILFWLLFSSLNSILYSLIIARLIASLYNFIINKIFVFKNDGKGKISFLKYYLLLLVLLIIGYFSIRTLNNMLSWNVVIAKVFTETILFFVSFYIQRNFIFDKR